MSQIKDQPPDFPTPEHEPESLKRLGTTNSHHIPLEAHGPLECPLQGTSLLNNPHFNKGSAFTSQERTLFSLNGLLPTTIHTLSQQTHRAYTQYLSRPDPLSQNVFLTSLRYQNIVLFYNLLTTHISELLSVIYTPTEGDAIAQYSHLFRRPEGVFLNVYEPENIKEVLRNAGGEKQDVDYIVVTDGEMILGIGDWGVGGIGISTAKLSLMTICAGLHPNRTLPIVIDCGTNNEQLQNDELYLGIRKPRLTGEKYDEYIEKFVYAIKELFPKAVLHFEDFGVKNARRILERYRGVLPCFNDDVQGTGIVTLAGIYAACWVAKISLKDVKVVIFGAGTAGVGIADMIRDAIAMEKGVSKEDASKQIYLLDKIGLVVKDTQGLSKEQIMYAKDAGEGEGVWQRRDLTSLKQVIEVVKPNILIGTSTKPGAFTEEVVKEMAKHVDRPVIFPLSNPTRLHEAVPEDLYRWTDGKALIATGSPFPPIEDKSTSSSTKKYIISECNNALAYPGLGLAAVLSRTKGITDSMLLTATKALASLSPALKHNHQKQGGEEHDASNGLLPDIEDIRDVSCKIAVSVIKEVVQKGFSRVSGIPVEDDQALETWVRRQMWVPAYRELVPVGGKFKQ